jgi:hypothetical protein
MEYVCPLCNGFVSVDLKCPRCGKQMKDRGEIEDFLGPYSPYTELHMGEGLDNSAGFCTHLFSCPVCGWDTRKKVQNIRM